MAVACTAAGSAIGDSGVVTDHAIMLLLLVVADDVVGDSCPTSCWSCSSPMSIPLAVGDRNDRGSGTGGGRSSSRMWCDGEPSRVLSPSIDGDAMALDPSSSSSSSPSSLSWPFPGLTSDGGEREGSITAAAVETCDVAGAACRGEFVLMSNRGDKLQSSGSSGDMENLRFRLSSCDDVALCVEADDAESGGATTGGNATDTDVSVLGNGRDDLEDDREEAEAVAEDSDEENGDTERGCDGCCSSFSSSVA